MKQHDEDRVWLVAAAMDTRNALQSQFIPWLDHLSRLVTAPEHDTDRDTRILVAGLIEDLRDEAVKHRDRLRLAIKGRLKTAPASETMTGSETARNREKRPCARFQWLRGKGLLGLFTHARLCRNF